MMAMAQRWQTFWVVRGGNDPAHCEDASAADDSTGRYALADGASEGCFSRLWAGMLVEDFVRASGLGIDRWYDSLPPVQQRWDADVQSRVLRPSARRAVRQGAFATFLGIVLGDPADPCRWQAVAVGDTCLMHTRGHVLLRCFPLDHATQFDNYPHLVGSRMPAEAVHQRQRLWADGRGESGDRLWAMTDALAQWCLAEEGGGGNPWATLESLLPSPDGQRDFAAWIEGLRNSRQLKNDDVTLLTIEL
jgi:hypothetical protein